MQTAVCCACHEEKEIFSLRKGVNKCADCLCTQIGRSTMDLFRKGIKPITAPVHVLVAVAGESSSTFLAHILKTRVCLSLQGKSAVVKKLETITSDQLTPFTLPNITRYASENDFNCVIIGDDASTVSLGTMAAISCGRPDIVRWISSDDFENYSVPVIRPVRQSLPEETTFYCEMKQLEFDNGKRILDRAFPHEKKLLETVVAEGHGATPFAVQKLAERLVVSKHDFKCPGCGLPGTRDELCTICKTIESCKQ